MLFPGKFSLKFLWLNIFAFLFFVSFSAIGASSISPEEAILHIGSQQTVCGKVANTKYAKKSRGKPTFINLNKPYPSHIFTALIWGQNRSKFGFAPESHYYGKTICVSGVISTYKGKAQIVVSSPSQIK